METPNPHGAFANARARFTELQRVLGRVSRKVLAAALRDLERDGLVARTEFVEMPPRVEYRVTECTQSLVPILRQLSAWAVAKAAVEA